MIGSHRHNATFDRAGWRKRLLLPCWILQAVILIAVAGLFSYRLSGTLNTWKAEEDKGAVPAVEFIWEGVNIAFSIISLVITLASIARFIAEALTPLPLLFSSILGLVLSGAILALDIVVYVQHTDKQYSLIGLGLDVALMIFTIIPLIYSIVIYRRLLTYDDYHLPGNVKHFGFSDVEETARRPSHASSTNNYLQPPAPYDPTNNDSTPSPVAAAPTSLGKRIRPRSLSTGRRVSLPLGRQRSASPSSLEPPISPPSPASTSDDPNTLQRRPSYDHRRDTSFDEYVSQRRRSSSLQSDVRRAIGTEFGWDPTSNGHHATQNSTKSRDSVYSAGSVPASHAQMRTRGNSLARQTSWEVSLSNYSMASPSTLAIPSPSTTPTIFVDAPTPTTDTDPSELHMSLQRGHSLISVPEGREDDDEEHDRDRDRDRDSGGEDRKALLGRSASIPRSRGSKRLKCVEGLEEIELEARRHKRES